MVNLTIEQDFLLFYTNFSHILFWKLRRTSLDKILTLEGRDASIDAFSTLIVNSVNMAGQKDLIFADFTYIGHICLPSKFEVFAISEK